MDERTVRYVLRRRRLPPAGFSRGVGQDPDKVTARVCKFLGDISYPLYMVHYPFIYLYYAWVKNGDLTFRESLPGALALFFGSVILAWLCLRLYDEPVRKFLSKHLLRKG